MCILHSIYIHLWAKDKASMVNGIAAIDIKKKNQHKYSCQIENIDHSVKITCMNMLGT